ncbi:hypothetical protein TrVFT333_000071 [Trichoderma virens FT-333]|nr:hypothetical protein TrVFT333_000071 [Trichoderma virens FT-333]
MSPRTVNNLTQHYYYFSHLVMLLNELFITPVQKNVDRSLFAWHIFSEFESLQSNDETQYTKVLSRLQIQILTSIYFLQSDQGIFAKSQIESAFKLILSHYKEFDGIPYGEFRLAHLALLRNMEFNFQKN